MLHQKMVTPAARREVVVHLQVAYEVSERRACSALGADRTSLRYLFGAACPERRIAAGLVMPTANAETMSLHLNAINRKVAPGAHAILVFDVPS